MCLTHNLLLSVCHLFSETEQVLFEKPYPPVQTLRDQMEITKQLLHFRGRFKLQGTPVVAQHSAKKTAMSKDIAIDYQPTPLTRHQVAEINPDMKMINPIMSFHTFEN